ncbi:hypothetical protein [Fictibacillus enclensis]|uniref:hypothetical protein n=1 Tax=Fictibacillus enclensis TaxID=1017270 RepID=UPI0024BFFA3A|nr:hypothetical protein [Fictibacillus enclensis]WHY73729.1 hypothetical protein QNH15_07390 [Fictibacillus enclensis]
MRKYLFLAAILLYLLSVFYPTTAIKVALSVVCILIVGVTFTKVSRTVQVISSIFILSGIVMLARSGADGLDYIQSVGPMINLLALFALVPILAIPIQLGNYAHSIQSIILRKIHNSKQLYFLTSGVSYFFSCFMNLASLPMTYYSVRPSASTYHIHHEERFMSRAITHGFAMPLLWTPVTPIVGIVINMTGVSWGEMLKYLIPLSFAGLLIDWLLAAIIFKNRRRTTDLSADEIAAGVVRGESKGSSGKLLQILLAILVFNSLVMFTEKKLHFDFLFIVTLYVVPFAFLWSFILHKQKGFMQEVKHHFSSSIVKLSGQFIIFLCAGFFISAMKFSNVDHVLNEGLLVLKEGVGSHIFLLLIPLVPLALAFTGLHPAVGLALMTEALDPSSLQIATPLLTLAMLGGAVSAFLMGPFNATIGMMASITNESPYRISNWNAGFTVSYLLLLMSFLLVLQWV